MKILLPNINKDMAVQDELLLFSTYRLYRDRQRPATWTQCPTLMAGSQGFFTWIIIIGIDNNVFLPDKNSAAKLVFVYWKL